MTKRIGSSSFFILCIVFIVFCSFSSCIKKNNLLKDKKNNEVLNLTIMSVTYTGEPVAEDSPVKKALEDYTNTKIQINWVPSTTYDDKITIALTSNELPMLMLVQNKSSSIINATRAGMFWNITPYLKDYPNLSKANKDVLRNISIDDKIYGIYRSRPYARGGLAFRSDWLSNIGMKEVKTIDDVYNMLKGFTTKDPDKNGKNDTYGLVATTYPGSFNVTATWFGAPNGWGEGKDGRLVPAHMTEEYMDTMKFWRKLYEEKLVNTNFAVFDSAKWTQPVNDGKAGAIIDISDVGQRMHPIKSDENSNPTIDVAGPILGPKGLKNLPTSGYSGMYMITKQAVRTEKELKLVLSFLDKLNDKKALDLLNNGIEGRQYKVLEGKYTQVISEPSTRKNEMNDLNQLTLGINDPNNGAYIPEINVLREKVLKLQNFEYDKYCVANPAEPFISNSYLQKGAQLDNIITDARIKYIIGQYNEENFKSAIELWRESGGDNIIREINEEYDKSKKK